MNKINIHLDDDDDDRDAIKKALEILKNGTFSRNNTEYQIKLKLKKGDSNEKHSDT